MKKLLIALLLVALLLPGCTKKETLTFVFTPGTGTDLAFTKEMYGALVKEVGDKLGVETKIVITTSAAATTEALRNGTADIARYGPFGYVMAVDEVGVIPLVRESVLSGGEYYHGLIIGRPGIWEEPFDIAQLRGKSMAFSEPGSTSGYLFSVAMMAGAGMTVDDLDSYSFAGSHPAVIEAVINGVSDAGSTNDRRLNIAIDSGIAVEGENFVYLAESPPIMANPWAARPDIKFDIEEIIEAFLSVSQEALLPADTEYLVRALDSEYDFVREMSKYE